MPTIITTAAPEVHTIDASPSEEVENRDGELEEPQQIPPPPPPAHAASVPPVAPTVPARVLTHIKAKDLTSAGDFDQRKTAKLFGIVVSVGAHILADGRSNTKKAWIDVYDAAFSSNPVDPGPLAAHKMFVGNDCQNKLKKLLLQAAQHYADTARAKEAELGAENDVEFTLCEELGSQIVSERASATQARTEQSAAKAAEKIQHKRTMEQAEAWVGAEAPRRGVPAPSGVDMDADIEEGLAHLGAQPISKPSPPVCDLLDDTSSDDEVEVQHEEEEVQLAGVVSPVGKNPPPARGAIVRDNLAREQSNAEAAAKQSAKYHKKMKKKKGKKRGPNMRFLPGHTDIVDICDEATKTHTKLTGEMVTVVKEFLAKSTSNNAAPESPKKARKFGEIASCEKTIQSLKQGMHQAQGNGDQAEVEDYKQRIKGYQQLIRDMEAELFNTGNHVNV